MYSENYKKYKDLLLWGNTTWPFYVYPKYNMITFAKLDFIKYALENNLIDQRKIKYVGFTDFGLVRDLSLLPSNREFDYKSYIKEGHYTIRIK